MMMQLHLVLLIELKGMKLTASNVDEQSWEGHHHQSLFQEAIPQTQQDICLARQDSP